VIDMKRTGYVLIVPLIWGVLSGCTGSQVKYIQENPNFLKPGLYAKAFIETWGQPDEAMAYQDYQAKYHYSGAVISGSRGNLSGYAVSGSVTPTTVVWIYRNQKKALYFQQKTLLNQNPGPIEAVVLWRLVGWENLINDLTTKPQVTPPEKPITTAPVTPTSGTTNIVTVTWTSANIRSGAGNSFPAVTTVKQGDRLSVIGEHGEWFNVRLEDGKEGWIKSGAVEQK
jgi:hypothetical protein